MFQTTNFLHSQTPADSKTILPKPFPREATHPFQFWKAIQDQQGRKDTKCWSLLLVVSPALCIFLHKPASAVPSIYKISEEFPQWMKHNMTLMPYNSALVTDLVNNELCIFEPSDCTYFFKALCSERKCLGLTSLVQDDICYSTLPISQWASLCQDISCSHSISNQRNSRSARDFGWDFCELQF